MRLISHGKKEILTVAVISLHELLHMFRIERYQAVEELGTPNALSRPSALNLAVAEKFASYFVVGARMPQLPLNNGKKIHSATNSGGGAQAGGGSSSGAGGS